MRDWEIIRMGERNPSLFEAKGTTASLPTLKRMLKSMGSPYTTYELHRPIEDVDTDKDRYIDIDGKSTPKC
ncbi:unnamed protein product [Dovyalis caffra]|uniref:Uncharacterized protein n=1 Tax=Dovyalis caffra TaxID=77055 RepID=A0AAV1RUE2_9ROSI|nr:unnamed protein product [Dovyalis caffra]